MDAMVPQVGAWWTCCSALWLDVGRAGIMQPPPPDGIDDDAKTPRVVPLLDLLDNEPTPNLRLRRDRAYVRQHAYGCRLPGGGLWKLALHTDRRFATLERLLWWAILAPPAALLLATALVLLYWRVRGR